MSSDTVKKDEPESKRPRIEAPSDNNHAGGGDVVDDIVKLDAEAAAAVFEKLEEVQKSLDAINEKASEEVLQVEQKYNKQRRPLFAKRGEYSEQLPQFWMTALMNHSTFAEIVTEEEEECLRSLTKLEVEDAEDIKSGCKVSFYFGPNRFFENNVVTKEFHTVDYEATCETTDIKWKIDRSKAVKSDKVTFFQWLGGNTADHMDILDVIREDIYPNPVHYFAATEGAAEEPSSESSTEEDEELADDSDE
jgi:template-activating factor I